jgi:hypothetical protein
VLFLTATSIGLCAGMMRSAFCIAFIAVLILVAFVAASLVSAGPTSYLDLLVAVLGYNFGLVNVLAGMLVTRRLRAA